MVVSDLTLQFPFLPKGEMKHPILKQPLIELDLPKQTLRKYVEYVFDQRRRQGQELKTPAKSELSLEVESITANDLIKAVKYNDFKRDPRKAFLSPRNISRNFERFVLILVRAGFTKLDWIYLPQCTISDEVLRGSPKAFWLDKSVLFLSLMNKDLGALQRRMGKYPSRISIGELIEDDYHYRGASFVKAQGELEGLGFTRQDGLFMTRSAEPLG